MDKVEVKRKDLIAFYKYKRTFVLIDEWGLYVMMLLSDSRKNSLVYWTDHLQPNVQEAWNHITFYRDQIKDYFSLKRQSPFTSTTSNEENK